MIIPFSDWQPDAADFGARGSTVITNAVPAQNSFQPFPSLDVFTDAINTRPRGGLEAFDKDLTSHKYVGNEAKIYELDESNLTWTDVTNTGGAYTTGAGEIWNFARWKNKVLGTNFTDNPQQITMGGANFSDLTTAFKARNIAVIGDFVVLSNTYDATDGNVPNRVRWSAIDDETDYTVSATTLSDYRDIPSGGAIRHITSGEVGIVVSERSIFRMQFVGAPVVFQIDEILPDVGAMCAGGVTELGESVFVLSNRGFLEITGNGTGINPIGAGRVDQWFLNEFDSQYPERVFSMPDAGNNRILWAFPGSGNTSGRPNKIIIYDRTFNKWALIEQECEFIFRAAGFQTILESLDTLGFDDLDEMTVSLDSNQWNETSQIAVFDSTFKYGFFTGESRAATLETGEIEINRGAKTALHSFKPLIDGGTTTAKVGHRSRLADNVTWTDSITMSSSGRCTKRVNDNYHRFQLTVTGEWTDAIGVQIDREDTPRSGRRA